MKRVISLAAILVSLSILFIGSIIIVIMNNQSTYGGTDFFENICAVIMFLSFFGFIATLALLIKQQGLPE